MKHTAARTLALAAVLVIAGGLASPANAAVPDGKGKHCSDQWCKTTTGIDWKVGG